MSQIPPVATGFKAAALAEPAFQQSLDYDNPAQARTDLEAEGRESPSHTDGSVTHKETEKNQRSVVEQDDGVTRIEALCAS